MNFLFLVLLLLLLILYIQYKIKINSKYTVLGVIAILILYELYNKNELISKNNFQQIVSEDINLNDNGFRKHYKQYNNSLDPYDYADDVFKNVIIPRPVDGRGTSGEYNSQKRYGLTCIAQKKLLDYLQQKRKISNQHGVLNKILGNPSNNQIQYSPTLLESVYDGYIDLNEKDLEVFNPVHFNESIKDMKCPTVCHIIDDDRKCRKVIDVPYMKELSDYNDVFKPKLEKCNDINALGISNEVKNKCNELEDCSYDDDYKTCYYDKRRCFVNNVDENPNNKGCNLYTSKLDCPTERCVWKEDSTNRNNSRCVPSIECLEKCNFFNIEGDVPKSKRLCENAQRMISTNEGMRYDRYCDWNNYSKRCLPRCSEYESLEDCKNDKSCMIDDEFKCIQK